MMGGNAVPDLTADVTHIIALDTTTEKYKAALRMGIHIVFEHWVTESFEKNQRLPELDYAIPPFHGLTISTTGLRRTDQRAQIERLVVMHGGTFSGDLSKKCTHLIAEVAKGLKYQGALKWGILVVNPDWLNECIKQKGKPWYYSTIHLFRTFGRISISCKRGF
jgi:NAD-dependent DNA ligase